MNFVKEVLLSPEIFRAIVLLLIAVLSFYVKKWTKTVKEDEDAKGWAKEVVMFIQQIAENEPNAEKLEMATEMLDNILVSRGINMNEDEIRVLIESAIGQFKEIFNR